jgi:predicted DsbA family dithiol-disulfide isomerase
MKVIEVFADVACPFTHVGLRRFTAYRKQRRLTEPILRLRAWPLEWVNGDSLQGTALAPKIAALQASVAPDLFIGFDETGFPPTTLSALAAEAAAYRQGPVTGERFSLAVRTALFERGLDVSRPEVLGPLLDELGVSEATTSDEASVEADFKEGERRGVSGSPHFFTEDGNFFCPSLDIDHHDGRLTVTFDDSGFAQFISAAFA